MKKGWWKDLLMAVLSALVTLIGKDTYDQAFTHPQLVEELKTEIITDLQPVIDSTAKAEVENELVHQYLKQSK